MNSEEKIKFLIKVLFKKNDFAKVVEIRTASNLSWSDVCFEVPAKLDIEAPEVIHQFYF